MHIRVYYYTDYRVYTLYLSVCLSLCITSHTTQYLLHYYSYNKYNNIMVYYYYDYYYYIAKIFDSLAFTCTLF